MHRFSGVALYFGAVALVLWLALCAYYPAEYAKWHALAISPVGRVVLMGWTLAFFYHLASGIRHLLWDMGKGFSLNASNKAGWFIVFFTIAATAGTWCYVYQQAGQL